MVVYGGVLWFMVVCPFVDSHAGQQKAAAGNDQSGSGAWWCMVVYCGLWWCVPLLIVTQGNKRLLPGVVKLAQVHGGVWWCIVVYGGVSLCL
jgi:hypothetical protein